MSDISTSALLSKVDELWLITDSTLGVGGSTDDGGVLADKVSWTRAGTSTTGCEDRADETGTTIETAFPVLPPPRLFGRGAGIAMIGTVVPAVTAGFTGTESLGVSAGLSNVGATNGLPESASSGSAPIVHTH